MGAGAFMLLNASKVPAEKKDKEKPIPNVSVESIEVGPLQLAAASQGEVLPRYETLLVSQVTGVIVNVSPEFVDGGIVKQGELLAQIDPFDYKVRVQQANANLASARAAFIQERAQGQVAEAEWASISTSKPSDLGLRKPQQEQALASVKASEAALTQAKKDLERTEIRAPFDALVRTRDVSLGQFVAIGNQLGQLMDISVAEIRLPVNQADFAILTNRGEMADVDLHGQSYGEEHIWKGRIVRDEGMVNAESRMIFLVAQVSDPYSLLNETKPRLPFGTYVAANIKGKEVTGARIPRRLFVDKKLPLIKENKLSFVEVTQLKQDGKFTIVSGGINTGDLILVSTLDAPVEGMAVSLTNEITSEVNDEKKERKVQDNLEIENIEVNNVEVKNTQIKKTELKTTRNELQTKEKDNILVSKAQVSDEGTNNAVMDIH